MFPHLITSEDSINKKEDRILNKDYYDPYKYEKKMDKNYEREEQMNRFNLNMDSMIKNTESENRFTSPNKDLINLNYNYEDFPGNKYKRKDNQNNNLSLNNSRSEMRVKRVSDIIDDFPINFSPVNYNSTINRDDFNTFKNEIKRDNEEDEIINNNLPNDFRLYNTDLDYYRNMIENMHSEIGCLNNKLNDLEKNNNLSSVRTYPNKDSLHSNTVNNINNSHLSTANFKYPNYNTNHNLNNNNNENLHINYERDTYTYRNQDYDRFYSQNIPNQDNINDIPNLNRNYSYKESYPNNEINNDVNNDLSSVRNNINNSFNQKENHDNITLHHYEEPTENSRIRENSIIFHTEHSHSSKEPRRSRIEKNEEVKEIKNKNVKRVQSADKPKPKSNTTSKTKNIKIPTPTKKQLVSKSPSQNKIVNKNKSTNLIPTKSKASSVNKTTSNLRKPSKSNSTTSSNEILSNVLKENEDLKLKISSLEKSLKNIKDNTHLDNIEKRGKDHLRVELEIWKNRSEKLSQSYLENLSTMKKQLIQDKTNFTDEINSIKNNYLDQINSLKNKYQSTLEKYEQNMKKLRKENEDLKKKVSKVKEILTPNL